MYTSVSFRNGSKPAGRGELFPAHMRFTPDTDEPERAPLLERFEDIATG